MSRANLLALVLFFLAFVFFTMYLASGVINVPMDVSKSLVDADAALIGFLGVITVFVFNTYRDESRSIEHKIEDLQDEHEDFLRRESLAAGHVTGGLGAAAEKEYAEFKKKKEELEARLSYLRKSSRQSFWWTSISALSFFASILLALLVMSETEFPIKFLGASLAMWAMGFGFVALFMMIWKLRTDLE